MLKPIFQGDQNILIVRSEDKYSVWRTSRTAPLSQRFWEARDAGLEVAAIYQGVSEPAIWGIERRENDLNSGKCTLQELDEILRE